MELARIAKDKFFREMNAKRTALTFDDVRLKTGHSEVMPDAVNIESLFSRNVPLKVPFVSAAMDTVTEREMAIGMAVLGGMGIIHKNLNPEEQAKQVSRVKHYLNVLISKPIWVRDTDPIGNILNMKSDKNYNFSTFPVLDLQGKLVGIVTQNDLDFCMDRNATAGDIMTKDPITGNHNITLVEVYQKMMNSKKKVLPLVNESRELVGMYIFSDVKRIMEGPNNMYNVDSNGQLRVGAAIGVGKDSIGRLEMLVEKNVDVVVIDTAHGDSKNVFSMIKHINERVKTKYSVDIVAGNVSEPGSAEALAKLDVDGIKVGQGGGSICTTRIVAGIGCPQVTAVYNCSQVADRYHIPVCSDGGIRNTGDIPIAIGAGAMSVMMGGMLAGTEEAPGEVTFLDGRQWKQYRGMGSVGALMANKGSRERYGQSEGTKADMVPEGVEGLVPYKGELKQVITQYIGGLKRGMGYVGADSIEELRAKADFWQITNAGQTESHPHDIRITEEPPNYSVRK